MWLLAAALVSSGLFTFLTVYQCRQRLAPSTVRELIKLVSCFGMTVLVHKENKDDIDMWQQTYTHSGQLPNAQPDYLPTPVCTLSQCHLALGRRQANWWALLHLWGCFHRWQ